VVRRFFDPSTNRWFRVFDRIRIGEPGRFQIFGKTNINFRGWVLQNPQRIAGFHERTSGSLPVPYRFFSFLILLLSRSWGRVVQSTGRVLICLAWPPAKNRSKIKGPPNTGSNPAEVITPPGYQYHHPFFWYPWPRPWAFTLHWNIPRLSCT